MRQDILENLGWRFHRIWSTDWFHHRKREIERLKAALERASDQIETGIRVRGANHASARPVTEATAEPEPGPIDIDHLTLKMPAYVRADLTVRSSVEPHEAPVAQLAELVGKIVAIEGPIHVDEVARRITTAFGKTKAGSRIVEATGRAVRQALRQDATLVLLALWYEFDTQVRDHGATQVILTVEQLNQLLKEKLLPDLKSQPPPGRMREILRQAQRFNLVRLTYSESFEQSHIEVLSTLKKVIPFNGIEEWTKTAELHRQPATTGEDDATDGEGEATA